VVPDTPGLFRFQTLLVSFGSRRSWSLLVLDAPGLFWFQTLLVSLDSRLFWGLDTPRSDPNIPCPCGESNPDLPG
jgi:hypothetical protein